MPAPCAVRMFGMVVERLVVTEAQKISAAEDKLVCTAGMVNLLCDTPTLLDGPYSQYWYGRDRLSDRRGGSSRQSSSTSH